MAKFLLPLACLICTLCAVVLAQEQCPADATSNFLSCVEAAEKSKRDAEKQQLDEFKQKRDQFKQKVDACFTTYGCTAPTEKGFGRKQKGSKSNNKSKSQSAEETEEQKNKTRECRKAIGALIEQRVQDCVQENTGVTSPLPHFGHPKGPKGHFGGSSGPHGGPGDHAGGKWPGNAGHPSFEGFGHGGFGPAGHFGGPHGGNLDKFKAKAKEGIAKLCVNNTQSGAVDSVIQCLNDTFRDALGEWNKTAHSEPRQPPAFFEQYCAAKNDCLSHLSCDQSQLTETIKKALKVQAECHKNLTQRIKSANEDSTTGLDVCQGVNLTHGVKGLGKSGEKPKGKGSKEKKHGSGNDNGHEFQWHDPCDIFKSQPERDSHKFGGGKPPHLFGGGPAQSGAEKDPGHRTH